MWYSPDSLVAFGAWASLIFLAPAEATLTARVAPADIARARASRRATRHACAARPRSSSKTACSRSCARSLEHSPRFRQQCRTLAPRRGCEPVASAAQRARRRRPAPGRRFAAVPGQPRRRDRDSQRARADRAPGARVRAPDRAARRRRSEALAKEGQARRLADGAFETARAIAAGSSVAGEVLSRRAGRSPCAQRGRRRSGACVERPDARSQRGRNGAHDAGVTTEHANRGFRRSRAPVGADRVPLRRRSAES